MEKDATGVSVVMAVYNGERFLAEAVESVLSQTAPEFELLVVDDGSRDRTADLARQVPGVRVLCHVPRSASTAVTWLPRMKHAVSSQCVPISATARSFPPS